MSQALNPPKAPNPPRLSADAHSARDDSAGPHPRPLDATQRVHQKHIIRDIKQAKNTSVFHGTIYDNQELLVERLSIEEGSWNAGGAFDRETAQLLIQTLGGDKSETTPGAPKESAESGSASFQGTGHVIGRNR